MTFDDIFAFALPRIQVRNALEIAFINKSDLPAFDGLAHLYYFRQLQKRRQEVEQSDVPFTSYFQNEMMRGCR